LKNKHFILLVILAVVVIVLMPSNESNAMGDIKVVLDGTELNFDVAPRIYEGRTLLPLRGIFEALGLTVYWDGSTKTITGFSGDTIIMLKIDDYVATVNGEQRFLDVPPKIINARTLVPARFIAESLGMDVMWQEIEKTVVITSNKNIKSDNEETITTIEMTLYEKESLSNALEKLYTYSMDTIGYLEYLKKEVSLGKSEASDYDLYYFDKIIFQISMYDDELIYEISNTLPQRDEGTTLRALIGSYSYVHSLVSMTYDENYKIAENWPIIVEEINNAIYQLDSIVTSCYDVNNDYKLNANLNDY
jgi:hypothetical protein